MTAVLGAGSKGFRGWAGSWGCLRDFWPRLRLLFCFCLTLVAMLAEVVGVWAFRACYWLLVLMVARVRLVLFIAYSYFRFVLAALFLYFEFLDQESPSCLIPSPPLLLPSSGHPHRPSPPPPNN